MSVTVRRGGGGGRREGVKTGEREEEEAQQRQKEEEDRLGRNRGWDVEKIWLIQGSYHCLDSCVFDSLGADAVLIIVCVLLKQIRVSGSP